MDKVLFSTSSWLEEEESSIIKKNLSIMLYLIKGPDHMTVYLSPASGVYLVRSSLGSLYPIQDEDGGDRLTYFIYYSHGTDVGPWEFTLYVAVSMQLGL